MQEFLAGLAATIAEDEHVLLVLDRAGWHTANALDVPESITLESLPARSPELNPVERLWLYLKKRFLSHRLLEDYALDEAAKASACLPLHQNAQSHHLPDRRQSRSETDYPL